MSREKRKAADEWTEATLLQDADRRGVYLASFAGVIPPPTTTFREYKRKRKDRGDEKDVILQGETERIEFEGRTTSTDNDDTCQYHEAKAFSDCRYAICIYNPEKESVKIVPAPMLHMQRSIKALKSRAEKADSDSSLKASFITVDNADGRSKTREWHSARHLDQSVPKQQLHRSLADTSTPRLWKALLHKSMPMSRLQQITSHHNVPSVSER